MMRVSFAFRRGGIVRESAVRESAVRGSTAFRAGVDTLFLLAAAYFLGGWSFFDPFHEQVEKGNRSAKERQTADALEHYEAAGKIAPASPIPDFNRGVVLSEKGDVEEARAAFQAAQASDDKAIAADAHYNLGNLLLEQGDAAGAIEEYLRSLDLDPADPDARRNLEIAIRKKEEQQKQQQQQPQKQDPSQQEEKKKEDQSREDESGDKKEDETQDPEQGKNEEEQNPQSSEENAEEQQADPAETGENALRPEERLSKEDAARLLNAIQSDELRVLRAMEEKKGEQGAVGNDW
jgi:Ca-activated chloride channel family protein